MMLVCRCIKAVALMALFANLGGCGNMVFEKVIAYERARSHLSVKTHDLSFGQVSYLTNDKMDKEGAIVMLHGFGSDKDSWVRFARELGDENRLIIPDLPGMGESIQGFYLNYGIQGQADRLREFLHKINARKVHIIASSLGGAVALRFTYLYPDEVVSLTLVSSSGAAEIPSKLDEVIKVTGKNPLLEITTGEDYKEMMKFVMVTPPYMPDYILEVLAEAKAKRKTLDQKILTDIAKEKGQKDILPKITVPTLIVWGKQDNILHVDNAYLLQKNIPRSRVVVFEQTGHLPMVEKPKEMAKQFRAFLRGLAALQGLIVN